MEWYERFGGLPNGYADQFVEVANKEFIVHSSNGKTRFRNLGSTALHLAYVAKGSMIGTIATATKIWDIAAGALIIENAGGVLTDFDGNTIFPIDDMEKNASKKYHIMASNKKAHTNLLDILKA